MATTVDGHGLPELAVILALGNGFIITSMLWISTVVAMIDGRLLRAAGCLLVAAALALFGLIHSVDPRGGIYLPWELQGLPAVVMGQFVGAYRSEEHTSELQSLMRISYAVFCLKKKNKQRPKNIT